MFNSLYVYDNWGKHLSHKKIQYSYGKKMFTRRAKPIRISGFLMYLKSKPLKDMGQIFFSYLAAAQLVKKFPTFYED